MSRVGKQPIKIENNVTVEIQDGGEYGYKKVVVKGPKGQLEESLRRGVEVEIKDNNIVVERVNDSKRNRSFHGLYRTLIANMIEGVIKGYSTVLELHGVGYRVSMKGQDLEFKLGLNHPIVIKAPEGITFVVKDEVDITISGINKQMVGQTAASIRELKKPEPYKGKGIRYKGEQVRRKSGKSASA